MKNKMVKQFSLIKLALALAITLQFFGVFAKTNSIIKDWKTWNDKFEKDECSKDINCCKYYKILIAIYSHSLENWIDYGSDYIRNQPETFKTSSYPIDGYLTKKIKKKISENAEYYSEINIHANHDFDNLIKQTKEEWEKEHYRKQKRNVKSLRNAKKLFDSDDFPLERTNHVDSIDLYSKELKKHNRIISKNIENLENLDSPKKQPTE